MRVTFRLRVLALVGLVAVTATAATSWITLRQASAQLTESAAADRAQIDTVRSALVLYGREHGTWEGVQETVLTLFNRFGQRLHLTTDSGIVIADTDRLQGRTARPLGNTTVFVDPRPILDLPPDVSEPVATVLEEIVSYRSGVLLAACLSRGGASALITESEFGIPRALPRDSEPETDRCVRSSFEPAVDRAAIRAAGERCVAENPRDTAGSCLRQLFTDQISDLAPVPLRAYIGARETPRLSAGPALAAAALVALFAIAGTTLISRRVLRPIATLTTASRRLGQGDLTGRVPVVGRDELAELARSFNRMADSLQRGEEIQRRLVADVAHELRTPLANLRGYLEALKDGVITPDTDLFASLHEEAVLQQRIVDDLQDLALAEAGSLAYHRTPVDLAELLETCRTAHHAVADAAGVRLSVEAETPVWVYADPDRLRQVLGNLVSNALRATPAAGLVRLSAMGAAGTAFLRVSDTGIGIAPEALPYVFDRFWRADSARNRRTGGSGLGLAIARQIVTDHNGGIAVTSTQGKGTTFTITLPTSVPPEVGRPRPASTHP